MSQPGSSTHGDLLWIRVGALGDLLIATAALEETQRRFPQHRVSLLGPRMWTQLVDPQLFPRIARVYALKGKDLREGFEEWAPSGVGADWKLAGEGRFDSRFWKRFQVVVNHRIESHRFGFQPWLHRVPIRIGSGPWASRFLYSHWSPDLGKDPLIHERDWHLRVATAEASANRSCFYGISRDRNRTVLNAGNAFGLPLEVWQRWSNTGLPRLHRKNSEACHRHGLSPRTYFLVNPTASRREKAWPSESYRHFLAIGSSLFGTLEPIVIGAPSETDWLKDVAGEKIRVLQPASVVELFHLVDGAAGLLTNASSMHFIAASTGTPAVVLMGRSDRRIWGPLGRNKWVVQRAPQMYQSQDIFEQEREAYAAISVDEVVRAVETCLRETTR